MEDTDDEPNTWQDITPITPFTGDYSITKDGSYTMWVKDSQDNKVFSKVIASKITRTNTPGINAIYLSEGDCVIGKFALNGTNALMHIDLDEHYENLKILVNNEIRENDTEFTVLSHTTIDVSCTPKSYTVKFDLDGKGNAINDISVVYLTLFDKPTDQYYNGEIVEGWYTDKNFTHKWSFDNDVLDSEYLVNGVVTLYAK